MPNQTKQDKLSYAKYWSCQSQWQQLTVEIWQLSADINAISASGKLESW